MRRNITPDVTWIAETFEFEPDRQTHVSVFLVETDEGHVLIDSGSHYHEEEILAEIRESVGTNELAGIVVSHADLPHAGNVDSLAAELGEFEVYCATAAPELVGIPVTVNCSPGETLELGDHSFTFIDAPLADITDTVWVFDHESGTLFTSDGFGSYHHPDNAEAISTELDDSITAEQIYEYHRTMFRWLELVDPDRLAADVNDLFERFDVECIAPTHGNPIVGADVEPYVERFNDVLRDIVTSYEVSDEPISTIDGIGDAYAERLREGGVTTVADLQDATVATLAADTGIAEARLRKWQERADAVGKSVSVRLPDI
jgi:flavorubredoxin